jgi:hypothetical protein
MIFIVIIIGIGLVYGAGYSAGKQSIRKQFDKLMHHKGQH